MSKQTAVMCLINELKKSKDFQRVINEVNLSSTSVRDIVQETLQMEREQMKLIYDGLLQNVGTSIKESDLPTFEQYYNETFGGQE
jgi:hypothetical protein